MIYLSLSRIITRKLVELDAMVFADVAIERFEMMIVDMGQTRDAYEYARTALLNGRSGLDPGYTVRGAVHAAHQSHRATSAVVRAM